MTAGSAAIAATAGGGLLPLAILLPALGVLLSFLIGGRRAEWIALGLMPVELGCRPRHRVSRLALRPAGRLHARRLCAAARHRAPRRRIFRCHARDRRADRAGRRAIRARQFRDAAGDGEARAPRLLDPAAGHSGGVEPRSFWAATCSISMSGSSFSPSPPFRWFAWTDVRRLWPRRCAISCSRCSARCSICSASPCSTAPMARSTSRSLLRAFAPSLLSGWRPD